MRHKRFAPILLSLLLATSALAQQAATTSQSAATTSQSAVPDIERLRAHVNYLASERLEGRRTGTQGAKDAADYIAANFLRYGLRPIIHAQSGHGSEPSRMQGKFFQEFPYVAGVALGGGNALKLTTREGGQPRTVEFRAGQDWTPLGFSTNAKVSDTPVVFVGYGITAAEHKHDDYAQAKAAGKVAVAFAGTPDGDNPHSRFARSGEVRFKAAAAVAAGAKALVLIAAAEEFKDDRLARLDYDNSGGDAGLPVIIVSRQAAAEMLGTSVAALATLENQTRQAATAQAQSGKEKLSDAGTIITGTPSVSISTDVVRRETPASNVVAMLEGSDPKLRDEYIVIGAHYDHLGRGGRSSLATREGDIHYGADDNASGTAVLMELAQMLTAERTRMKRSVLFIAFGGEEEGLLGSKHFVNHPPVAIEKMVAMLNLDMVGRLRADTLNVGGVGTAAEWREMLNRVNSGWKVDVRAGRKEDEAHASGGASSPRITTAEGEPVRLPNYTSGQIVVTGANGETAVTATPALRFNLRLNEDGFGPSDHASFYLKKVPVLFFFTGTHEDYHKPTDTADRVNYEGLTSITSFVRDIIGEIQAAAARPTFTTARGGEMTSRSTTFRVSLGTIPAYGDSTDGLKLDGVREGSPAERAGLRAGDRIVRMAGRDVRNVYDYTQALSEMNPDQEYEVEVVRGDERLAFRITPAARR